MEITGPFSPTGLSDTPSRRRLLVCTPATEADELPCARRVLSVVARRAFRRPVTDDDLSAPLAFYQAARGETDGGAGFEAGIQAGLTAILASPKFLYRAEIDPPALSEGAVYRISDLDLASRLSFFLWSRLPDEALLAKAAAGRCTIRVARGRGRADADRPARRVALHQLRGSMAWRAASRRGRIRIRCSSRASTKGFAPPSAVRCELFVGSIMHEDRSVVDLLTADYTFVNERLAPPLRNPERARRTVPARHADRSEPLGAARQRRVLMVTSYPNRTAPVLRGAWILENLMGTPPSPPPPDVEALQGEQRREKAQTVRELMEQHRAKPCCNACHGVMDPLGFALENFDAVGEWRYQRSLRRHRHRCVRAARRRHAVGSPRDLRKALTKQPEQFVQTMTEKLMTYALGRNLEYSRHARRPRNRPRRRA